MYRYRKMDGVPVISQATGDTVGAVAGLVVDPDRWLVRWLSVNSGGRYHGRHWVCLDDVVALDYDAVTIRDEESIRSPRQAREPEEWIQSGRRLLGMALLNERGEMIGRVEDYEFAATRFPVMRLVVAPGGNGSSDNSSVAVARVKTFAAEGIVIDENASSAHGEPAKPARNVVLPVRRVRMVRLGALPQQALGILNHWRQRTARDSALPATYPDKPASKQRQASPAAQK